MIANRVQQAKIDSIKKFQGLKGEEHDSPKNFDIHKRSFSEIPSLD